MASEARVSQQHPRTQKYEPLKTMDRLLVTSASGVVGGWDFARKEMKIVIRHMYICIRTNYTNIVIHNSVSKIGRRGRPEFDVAFLPASRESPRRDVIRVWLNRSEKAASPS